MTATLPIAANGHLSLADCGALDREMLEMAKSGRNGLESPEEIASAAAASPQPVNGHAKLTTAASPNGTSETDTRKWGVRTLAQLKRDVEREPRGQLVEGLLPEIGVVLCAGESGEGKSPLWYQAAVSEFFSADGM